MGHKLKAQKKREVFAQKFEWPWELSIDSKCYAWKCGMSQRPFLGIFHEIIGILTMVVRLNNAPI
jgi:hypothetical protein